MRRSNRSIMSEGVLPMTDMYTDRDVLAKRLASLEETFNKSLHLLNKANRHETVTSFNLGIRTREPCA